MNIDDIVREAMENSNFMETLKAKIQEAEEKAKSWPNEGDCYYYWGDDYEVGPNIWSDTRIHRLRKEAGRCFKTRAKAEFACKCAFYRDKFRSLGRPFIRGRENWFISYDYEEDKFEYCCCLASALEVVCFNSKADAQKALDEIGFENYYKYIICGKE